jgi:MFS family permease
VGGALICTALITIEIGRVFEFSYWLVGIIIVVLVGIYGSYTRSFGRPMFLLMLIIMMPLATTELGVDSWITDLMTPEFRGLGFNPGWVLVYTSAIMMALRFFAGPIVHRISPLGLLAACSATAAVGLLFLSQATGLAILVAATLYGVGKSFFWPTSLGFVAEQFPRGGALTLNAVAGVGMLAVGIVGNPFLGYFQDTAVNANLLAYDRANNTELHDTYVTLDKAGVFGRYEALDGAAVAAAPDEDRAAVARVQSTAKKDALKTVAVFPLFMLLCYVGLIVYFRRKGGYRSVQLTE